MLQKYKKYTIYANISRFFSG